MKADNIIAVTPGEGWYAQMMIEPKGEQPRQLFDRVIAFIWRREPGEGLQRFGSSPDGAYFEDDPNFRTYIHESELQAMMVKYEAEKGQPRSSLFVPTNNIIT